MQRHVKNFIRYPLYGQLSATTFVRLASESSYLPLTEIKERSNLLGSRSNRSLYDEEYDSFSGVFESTSVKFDRAHYCLRRAEKFEKEKRKGRGGEVREKIDHSVGNYF